MAKNVIELNGQRYDASTGKIVGTTNAPSKPAKKTVAGPQHLDGFSRRPSAPRAATPIKAHHQPEKSKTLMRAAVKKPVAPAKIHAKAPATTPVASKPQTAPSKVLSDTIRPGRIIRAAHTQQSNLISKFGAAAAAIKTEALAVAPAPPVFRSSKSAATPPPIINHPAQTVVQADPFQSAIEQSVSHEQPKAKKPKLHHRVAKKLHVSPRVINFAAVTIIALAAGGIIAYQNMPELAMRVASARAGLKASLPSYQPSGFSMAGPIKYQPGEVTVNYKSNSDNRGFDVVQKNSSWNSETLLENYVNTTDKPYQTFQANGRTIYIYDGNKATWVDGGIWYNVDGKSNLNSDQLLRIAGGL